MNSHTPMIFRVVVNDKKRKRTVLHIVMLFVSDPDCIISMYDFKEHGWLKDAEVDPMPEETSPGGK